MQAITLSTQELNVRCLAAPLTSLAWQASWIEFSGSTIQNPQANILSASGFFNNTASVAMVPSPTPGNQNQVKFISIYNTDAPTTHTIQVCYNNPATNTQLVIILGPGEHLQYVDSRGWYVLDVNGSIKVIDSFAATKQVYTRIPLSGGTGDGRPISVAATATPGTIIHDTIVDQVYIWATNRTGTAATLTIEWGGTATSDHMCSALVIPANSPPILICDGQILSAASGRIRAFSGTANAINLSGYADRIT